MATIVWTPASRARAKTCSRSGSNCLPSRCACESTNMLVWFVWGRAHSPVQVLHPFYAASRSGPQCRVFQVIADVTARLEDVPDRVLYIASFGLQLAVQPG